MQVQITGKNLDIGNALREHIEERVSSQVAKYFERAISASVTVEKQKNSFFSECILHLATGLTLASKGKGGDAYSAFDISLEHLETRLRRYKRRLNNHHRQRQEPISSAQASGFVIAAAKEAETEEPEELSPAIIAETTHKISRISVGEAVMKLEISDAPFVLFKNDKHDAINIVYRREDGNIGWIDPTT